MNRVAFLLLARGASTIPLHRLKIPQHRCRSVGTLNGFQRCYESSSTPTNNFSELIDCPLSDEDFDFGVESSYLKIDFDAVCGGNPETIKTLKKLQLEIDIMHQQGLKVPKNVKPAHWQNLLRIPSKFARDRYLAHLWLIEIKKMHRRERNQLKNELFAVKKAEKGLIPKPELTTSSPIVYGLTETSLFYRIRQVEMNNYLNYKLLQAEWFGPALILDCGFEPFMTQRNLMNCIKQILFLWSANRENFNPFDLHMCNVNVNGQMWSKFRTMVPTIDGPISGVHFSPESYLNFYPKEKLVYLTPDAMDVMETYNCEDIYIIGGYVDAHKHEPLTLAKAKKEGLRMAKLPLDKYLQWSVGTKSLTLNQVLLILNDVKDGLPWIEALKHVPKRKIGGQRVSDSSDSEYRSNHMTAEAIRENYRKNLVYDLLMQEKLKTHSKDS